MANPWCRAWTMPSRVTTEPSIVDTMDCSMDLHHGSNHGVVHSAPRMTPWAAPWSSPVLWHAPWHLPRAHGPRHGTAHGRIVVHGMGHGIVHGRPLVRPWTTRWRRVSMTSFMDDTMAPSMGDPMHDRIYVDHLSRPKREPRPWQPPQLRTPRRLDSQTTEIRKHTNNMPLMPVMQLPSLQPKPWPMGPSLIGSSAAVHSKFGCCSK